MMEGAMEKQERSEVIMVRVSAQDKKVFEEAAEKLDMKLSEFMRAATLLYLAITVNRHGLKSLAKGVVNTVQETMEKLREPGLRKIVSGWKKAS
jgi:uncharacterized protein (DUF1778 family)